MVSAIGSSGGYDAAQIQLQRSQAADKLLKAADANHDGKITEQELGKVMEAQGDQKGPSAAELFKQLDQGSKGYITKQDLEDRLAKADQAKAAQAPGKGGAPRAGKGKGDAEGAGAAGTITALDPQDLNQDGTVTMREKVQYGLKLYEAQKAAEKQTQSSQSTAVYA